MIFNFNDFLISISTALDFVEMDMLSVTTNHSKRVGYIAFKLAKEFNLNNKEQIDILSLSILHDNGLTQTLLDNNVEFGNFKNFHIEESFKDHCIIGENNIKSFPFLTNPKNIIKYHHETYDGKGFFGLKGEEIPIMAQLIGFADYVDFTFNYENVDINKKNKIIEYVKSEKDKRFSKAVVDAFLKIANSDSFWISLKNENIKNQLKREIPNYEQDLSFDEILRMMNIFSKIIDSKSKFTQKHSCELSQKVSIMADNYEFSHDEKIKLIISAKLHDIGKLAISNSILDKPGKLSDEEFSLIKKHSYYTKVCLKDIKGFEEITKWASNHHEKLNGKGYPNGLNYKDLDFNSRLMTCLDIYQALTEDRPYRKPLSHEKAISILKEMGINKEVDLSIVNDIDKVFSPKY
ncbi:HD-GYP domain-containing protein [Tepidibacter thalassicus]|uniref:HD domain-containing protein n=1 Tax=Tepidibacter thalassicus DSM 15285 TaxID=1123350 RepID=A0A1M5SH81_9FIRM|nr:HD domain-containing phosphohydrolase [Tepidibacter thalassicus]SHH37825.1 HD domain-containing protein [Tepidibacter thalassicus DSM 15285]